jgi:hypothetical protein
VKEVEEDEAPEEKKWPERILPELTEVDKSRLKRQRNVGMCVGQVIGDGRKLMIVRRTSTRVRLLSRSE